MWRNLRDFVDLLETEGLYWDHENGEILANKDAGDKGIKVCGTFYSILVKDVLGANERVSLEPPEGRNPQDKALGFFRRVV